ncbi:hypothetical protein Tco_1386959, partial [Tanacetum coccineum]
MYVHSFSFCFSVYEAIWATSLANERRIPPPESSHRLSKVLRTRYKEVIAIKTGLEARPINHDTKVLLDFTENTICIVKRFRKRIKDLPFDHG